MVLTSHFCDRHARTRHAHKQARTTAGVTLIELLIVTAIIALVAGLAFPSAAAGVEQMRLRSTADSMVNFLNTSIDRAERRQQVVELWISPHDNTLIARSPDQGYLRRLDLPEIFHISSIRPAEENDAAANQGAPRHFLLYPGGTVPRMAIEISSANVEGAVVRKRVVMVDPFTGIPRSLEVRAQVAR